jgi:hypothetical protein
MQRICRLICKICRICQKICKIIWTKYDTKYVKTEKICKKYAKYVRSINIGCSYQNMQNMQNMFKICKICKSKLNMQNMHSPLCWWVTGRPGHKYNGFEVRCPWAESRFKLRFWGSAWASGLLRWSTTRRRRYPVRFGQRAPLRNGTLPSRTTVTVTGCQCAQARS